jgi:AcrR family transcriptional regulator
MGRRAEHSMDQIRGMALAAAEALVRDKGLAGLSTRNIAKAIGYTSGTLYQAFRNLDDLVLQLNGRTIAGMAQALGEAVDPKAQPGENVRHICRAYLKFGREHLPQWELLFQRQWPAGFVYPAWYMAEMGKSLVIFERQLAGLLGSKASPHQISMAGRAVWCSMHGIHALYATGRLERLGVGSLDELVEFQIDALLRGLGA